MLTQLGEDRIDGIRQADSRERVFGAGPGLLVQGDGWQVLLNAYKEWGAKNRPEGSKTSCGCWRHYEFAAWQPRAKRESWRAARMHRPDYAQPARGPSTNAAKPATNSLSRARMPASVSSPCASNTWPARATSSRLPV